jgi:hypothetical protein
MDYRCPWCDSLLVEVPEAGWWTCKNPACFSPRLARQDVRAISVTRARLIAEAVKAALESAAVECDKQAKAWAQHLQASGVARQCAASIRAMSVKANEETSND